MRKTSPVLLRGLLATIGIAVATRGEAQSSTPAATVHAIVNTGSTRGAAGYSAQEADFVVGKTVYLKSTKTRIGTIESTDASHGFPRSFPHSPAKAVLIRRKDGPIDWVPVDGITRIYVVDR